MGGNPKKEMGWSLKKDPGGFELTILILKVDNQHLWPVIPTVRGVARSTGSLV